MTYWLNELIILQARSLPFDLWDSCVRDIEALKAAVVAERGDRIAEAARAAHIEAELAKPAMIRP
jgi:hypothetical protein